ncbi:hypothetical protein Tco_1104576 [Tanacetum coccineum]
MPRHKTTLASALAIDFKSEIFYSIAGNLVKEILLKLNLPDHRILKDGGEVDEKVEASWFCQYFSTHGLGGEWKLKQGAVYLYVGNAVRAQVWGCEALVKRGTPEKLQQRSIKCIFVGYPKETMGYYFYFLPKNKIVVERYTEFFKKNIISQEAKVEEHSLGDLNAPTNNKAALLDLESSKGLDAMNAEMQSMKDNHVLCRLLSPPNAKNRLE